MTRIEWSADGEALLAFASGHVRGLARDGRERFALPGELELRDARWRGEQVATIDRAHVLRVHRASGALDEERVQSRSYQRAPWASMSRGAARIASQEDGIVVRGETGAPILRFGRHEIVALHTDIPQRQDPWSRPEYVLAGWLSEDGARLSIAFRSGGDVGDEPGQRLDGVRGRRRAPSSIATGSARGRDIPRAGARRGAGAGSGVRRALPDGPTCVVAVGAGPLHAHPTLPSPAPTPSRIDPTARWPAVRLAQGRACASTTSRPAARSALLARARSGRLAFMPARQPHARVPRARRRRVEIVPVP